MGAWVGGWMDVLELNIFFNNISVISWWWKGDHEVLCNEDLLDAERIFEPDLKMSWSKVRSANCNS